MRYCKLLRPVPIKKADNMPKRVNKRGTFLHNPSNQSRKRLFMLGLLLSSCLTWGQDSLSSQLARDLSGGEAVLSLFAQFEDHPRDDINYPIGLWIKQELELGFSQSWSLQGALSYHGDNRHYTAGILDEVVEESQRRYHFNFREAYLRYQGNHVSFSVGKKIYSWGKADSFNPTDNLNPLDHLDFLYSEKKGILSSALSLSGNTAGLDLVWVPLFTPSRVPALDNRWIVNPSNFLPGDLSQYSFAAADLPERDLSNSQAALRLWMTRWGFDLALTAYRGFDPIPAVQASLDLQTAALVITPVFNEIEEYGLALSRSIGGTTLNFESSYRITESDFDDDFLSFVLGINRNFYIGGWFEEIILIAEYADEGWIHFKQNDNRLTTNLSRPFQDTFNLDLTFKVSEDTSFNLRGSFNAQDVDSLLAPQLILRFSDAFKLETGLHIFDGKAGTFWGNWADNDRFFAQLTYYF